MYLPDYERDVIRPHVFDRFRDLLEADAQEPGDALLSRQLDERGSERGRSHAGDEGVRRRSSAFSDGSAGRVVRRLPPPLRRRQNANANSGKNKTQGSTRTTGASCWSSTRSASTAATRRRTSSRSRARSPAGRSIATARFRLRSAALHDAGEKIVLGHTIKAGGGIDDGEQVLDIVASHPSTAHHIAFELAQRLVADEPPPALVDRAAARFRETDGDLREVVKTIVTSPEFCRAGRSATRSSRRRSSSSSARVRTTGADGQRRAARSSRRCSSSAMPLYMCQPPTGYTRHGRCVGLGRRPRHAHELRDAASRPAACPA